jgi:hypothetical protein
MGIAALLAGTTRVLSELKSALNTIWRTQEHSDVKEIVKKTSCSSACCSASVFF